MPGFLPHPSYARSMMFADTSFNPVIQMIIYNLYDYMPMQYIAVKPDNFQLKMFDIFLILAQNIYCGHTLELPH